MLNNILIILCALIISTSSTSKQEGPYRTHWGKQEKPIKPHSPKVYEINLDLPLEERWKEVIQDHKPEIDRLLSRIWLKNFPIGILDYVTYPIASNYNQQFAEEIRALAKLADVSFTKLLFLNFLYDLGAACSSILIQDPLDNVILARTLDFGLTEYIAGLAYHGKYYRGGKLIYEAVDVAGYTGVVTAMKPNEFAFSINEYFVREGFAVFRHAELVLNLLKQLYNGRLTPPYIARKALEQAEDYDSFVKMLSDTPTSSNVYYIVAGKEKRQGVVIAKFGEDLQNVTKVDAEGGEWFIAQTNYVRDAPDPKSDNRRTAETDRLKAMGRDVISYESIMENVMNLYPTFNAHTIHTTIMQPNKNYFNTTVWF